MSGGLAVGSKPHHFDHPLVDGLAGGGVMRHCLMIRCMAFLVLLQAAAANNRRVDEWMYERVFAASEKPLLANAITSNPKGKAALNSLQGYYERMESVMARENSTDVEAETYVGNIHMFLRLYGWPTMAAERRIYLPAKPSGANDVKPYRRERKKFVRREKTIFQEFVDFGNALDSPIAQRDVKKVLRWKHVFHNNRINYTTVTGSHKCEIRANLAHRVNGSWYLGSAITNERPAVHPAEFKRFYATENVRISRAGIIEYQPYMFDLNHNPRLTRKYWKDRPVQPNGSTPASTIVTEYGGSSGVYFFITEPVENNIALRAALSDGDHTMTLQAVQTSLPPNIAIIVFPLFMSLVPLALFADASNRALLGYMIFTDFVAVLPVAVKGVEVLSVVYDDNSAARTMVYGNLRDRNSTVAAVTWACRCEAVKGLTVLGFTFVSLAVFAMVTGIALEFVVRAQVQRNNQALAEKKALWGGAEDEYLWTRGCQCGECEYDSASEKTPPSGGLLGQFLQKRKEASLLLDEFALGVRPCHDWGRS